MKISILTLFPEMFDIFNHSIIGKAKEKELISIDTLNIRDYTLNKHKKVDDYPYGGGAGMVMAAQPVVDCIRACKESNNGKVIFLGPKGKTFNQELATKLSKEENLIFICGHYEGIDERAFKEVDMEISPGVLNKSESHEDESFSEGLLEYPQYTRPEVFEGEAVPSVLLSGHHENIRKWRRLQSLHITRERRPDLYNNIILTKEDKKLLNSKK